MSPPEPRRSHTRNTAYLDGSAPLPSASSPTTSATPLPAAGPAPGGLSKPFHLGDVARAALAHPRWAQGSRRGDWADHDGASSESDSDDDSASSASSSSRSSPASTAPSSRFSSLPSSCALTPSSSSEGFTRGVFPTPIVTRTATTTSHPAAAPAVAPTPVLEWPSPDDFKLRLLFSPLDTPVPSSLIDDSATVAEDSVPPAFYPGARISFCPRLSVTAQGGIPFSSLGGMHLGLTGMCETLDSKGNVESKRMIADFVTDLSSGLALWERDGCGEQEEEPRLKQGLYSLPLSMRLPAAERLPPSFECAKFRIHYVLSVALFSSAVTSNGTPRRLKISSVPFHVLPSTLPISAPTLPILSHDPKQGIFTSILKSLPFASPRVESGSPCLVYPSIPTTNFSPASHASIPVTLRIVDRPLEPTDLYVRLAIVRKTYIHESATKTLGRAIEDEWGLGAGVLPQELGFSEETVLEPWCREEEEVVSRWGWIPYSSRLGADANEKAEVLIQNIALPLSGVHGEGWAHGYSTSLDLDPTVVPSQTHGDCSWFSPAFRSRLPIPEEYARHVHVSSRFYLSVQVGFATPALRETLLAVGQTSPDMELASPNGFTQPCAPSTSRFSGASLANPFAAETSRTVRPSSSSSPRGPAFPGKLRELCIPITIGSVAEPAANCFASPETAAMRADREQREERGEDVRDEAEMLAGMWMCAPPTYGDALRDAPAYS